MAKFTDPIDNSDDILDSRNILSRYEHVTDEINSIFDGAGRELFDLELLAKCDNGAKLRRVVARMVERLQKSGDSQADDLEEYFEEWILLKDTFIDNLSYSNMREGIIFLRDSYMDERWAEQEARDLGYLSDDLPYLIESNIDFKGILEDLQNGYTSLDFDGVTYWYVES